MTWDDADFFSNDPLVRYNAHQAAKGKPQLPDPDEVRKAKKEEGEQWDQKDLQDQ